MPLSRAELDVSNCQVPGCTHEDHSILYLAQRCHPRKGVDVAYNKLTGTLNVVCSVCSKPVAEVYVAEKPPEAAHGRSQAQA